MSKNNIESYFKNKENNISISDKQKLSNMRYEVLNGKEKKSFVSHFKYAFATALAAVPVVFLSSNMMNTENIDLIGTSTSSAEVAYISSQEEIAVVSTFDKSILDWTVEDFNYAMVIDEYEEDFLDYYL